MLRFMHLFLPVLVLAACDATKTDFPVRPNAVEAQAQEFSSDVAVIPLTADNIEHFAKLRNLTGSQTTMPSIANWNYRVGVGDILDIVVWEHPELTMPAGEGRTPQESGLRVQSDGTFFYPYVGQVKAKGLTPEQIGDDLSKKLTQFIPNPQMVVRVVGYNSQAVSVTGSVKAPTRQQLTAQPLTLLDAVNAAGGLTEDADPRSVLVRRDGHTYTVDMQAFLERGVAANNPILQDGDVVSVSKLVKQEAYLLGQIAKPSTIDLTQDNVTLTQALTQVGGLREENADARGIFVFRKTASGTTVAQLDASSPTAFLLGAQFVLLPQDVVYVTTAPLSRWNRLISSIMPTVQAARTVD